MGRSQVKGERPPTSTLSGKSPNRVLVFYFGAPTPSSNEWHKKHWSVYSKIKKAWVQRLGLVVRPTMYGFSRAEIVVTRIACSVLDTDNAVAGLKPIIDSLVALGVFPNDTPHYLPQAPQVFQSKAVSRNEEGCAITIYERDIQV